MSIGELKISVKYNHRRFTKKSLETQRKAEGGSSSISESFITIKIQIICGNQFIKFKRSRIDVNFIYTIDLTKMEKLNLRLADKITHKQNGISEMHKIKPAIPKQQKKHFINKNQSLLSLVINQPSH